MITAIRDVRRARGMTLEEVAAACAPPTTAQTIGRLETGARTVTVAWLNRIAAALGVAAADLVTLPDRVDLPVAAVLDTGGARAPRRAAVLAAPRPDAGLIAVAVLGGTGDYRQGDELWCRPLDPPAFAGALNRDVLVPSGAGRFVFGRLIGFDAAEGAGGGRLHLLPPGAGSRQQLVVYPPWIAVAERLVRRL